jgi:hypothetical protein
MHSLPLDESTADRLLARRISPEEAPEGLAGVAALLRTAAGATIPAELAHEAEVVTAGMALLSAAVATDSSLPEARRERRLSRLMTAKFAAVATVAALGLGAAAAAATGSLPGQDSSSANPPQPTTAVQSTGSPQSPKPASTQKGPVTPVTPGTQGRGSKSTPPSSIPSTGPANQQAQPGLCTAYLAPKNSSTTSVPPRDFATAFRNLIGENDSSATKTATYCQSVSNPNATENNTSQNADKTNDNGKQSGSGNASGTSNHSGAGNQSNAGSSSNRGQSSSSRSGGSNTAGINKGVGTATTSGNGHSPVSVIVGKR